MLKNTSSGCYDALFEWQQTCLIDGKH